MRTAVRVLAGLAVGVGWPFMLSASPGDVIGEVERAGAPTLMTPGAHDTLLLRYADQATLTFTWRPPSSGPTPTRYQLCLADAGQSCQQPGSWIFPFPGQPAITETSYTARLPARFQGKRFQWSVAACAPPRLPLPGEAAEVCTYANLRPLSWQLPPPTLGLPADHTNTSLRPTLTIRENVPGADRYLFCLAKPGVECPQQPTSTADVIVAEVRGALQYTPPTELTQFEGHTLRWTAAACNDTFACIYQQPMRALTFSVPVAPLTCATIGNEIHVRNGRYVARISKGAIEMTVTRLNSDGSVGPMAYSGDRIGLGFDAPLPPSVTDAQLTDVQASVEKCFSFYARVSVTGRLVFENLATFRVKRTYEFTHSRNIYVQMELRVERAYGPVRVVPEDSVRVWSLIWNFGTDAQTTVFPTTNDLIVQIPDGPLGGLNDGLFGHHARSQVLPIGTTGGWSRRVVADGKLADGHAAVVLGSRVLLSNGVIAIDAPAPLDFASDHYLRYQLYPTFGMQDFDPKDEAKNRENTYQYYFNKWNGYKYAMENVIPINPQERYRQTEDALIRYTMFLIERLALDQGWWKHFPTEISGRFYPRGDRASTNSRSFPALAYVWAYLTMRRTPQGWRHVPSDADLIYHELQKIYQFYITTDPTPNLADHTPSGVPYIAYSAHYRERLGGPDETRRIINVHSQALHFAWLMQEASRLYGDSIREQQWAEIVARYHRGSQELFRTLYPGQDLADPPRTYLGLIGYSLPLREAKMAYVAITFEGLPAGYLLTGEYEPEFADVVERASRLDTVPLPCRDAPEDERADRCNADGTDKKASWPYVSYAWRLIRAFPAALAFARSQELNDGTCIPPSADSQTWGSFMSYDLSTASLSEVLGYDHAQEQECLNGSARCIHSDPTTFISEGNGRKWILTNTRFQSYWSPGFWEEVEPSRVPAHLQFAIRVTSPPPPRSCLGEHYSAYRMGNKLFIMTDYTGGTLTLELPGSQLPRGHSQLSIRRRPYNATTGRWAPEQLATGVAISPGSNGKVLVQLQEVQRKALTIVEIQP